LRHNLISIINYGVLVPFFLVGIWLSVRNRSRAGLILAVASVVYYSIRAFYGGSERARLPIEPLIILLAFYAVIELYARYRASKAPAFTDANGRLTSIDRASDAEA
jgi:hypothetical protein